MIWKPIVHCDPWDDSTKVSIIANISQLLLSCPVWGIEGFFVTDWQLTNQKYFFEEFNVKIARTNFLEIFLFCRDDKCGKVHRRPSYQAALSQNWKSWFLATMTMTTRVMMPNVRIAMATQLPKCSVKAKPSRLSRGKIARALFLATMTMAMTNVQIMNWQINQNNQFLFFITNK